MGRERERVPRRRAGSWRRLFVERHVWTTSTDACWFDPTDGPNGGDVPWSDGSIAVFAGTAGTVEISGQVSPASIIVATDGYSITSSTSPSDDTLVVYPGGTSIAVADGLQATISANIIDPSGSETLTVGSADMPGTVTLSGSNTPGGVDLEGGTLVVGSPSALGSGTLTVNAGAGHEQLQPQR